MDVESSAMYGLTAASLDVLGQINIGSRRSLVTGRQLTGLLDQMRGLAALVEGDREKQIEELERRMSLLQDEIDGLRAGEGSFVGGQGFSCCLLGGHRRRRLCDLGSRSQDVGSQGR